MAKKRFTMTQADADRVVDGIVLWETGKNEYGDRGSRHACALCRQYWYDNCIGCPISVYTGKRRCRGTPYDVNYKKCAPAMVRFLTEMLDAAGYEIKEVDA